MNKLLIVDDEQHIREVIREYAEFSGYEVDEASNGFEAIDKCRNKSYDILIIDVMMPKLDGFSAVKELRKFSDTPILMLSARGEEYDKLFGFEMGVDDYVVKPFSPKEIMARLQVILKRHKKQQNIQDEEIMEFGELKINVPSHVVTIQGKKVDLTPKEYDLLLYLALNKNIAISRDQLLDAIWGYDFFGDDRTVDTHIKMLRSSLSGLRNMIVTVRGVGYKFEAHE